jgi:competence protein ComEC
MTKPRKLKFEYIALALLILCSGIWVYYFGLAKASPSSDILAKVFFLDVGQGDSAVFSLPGSVQILIDAGPDEGVLDKLSGVMPPSDRELEYVFLTHPDLDHIGGFEQILDSYKIDNLYTSGKQAESKTYQRITKKVSDKNISEFVLAEGDTVSLGEYFSVDILWPPKDQVGDLSSNDSSLVAKFDAPGDADVMMLADAESKALDSVSGDNLETMIKSEIIKASHHGSANGVSENLIKKVGAKYAVISVGQPNRYGHPADRTINFFKKLGTKIFRTDELGTIGFDLTENGWEVGN